MSARVVVLFSIVVTCLPRHDSGLPQDGIAVMFVNSTDYKTNLVVPIRFNYSMFSDLYDCLQYGHESCSGRYNNSIVNNVYQTGDKSNSSLVCYYCKAWYNLNYFTCERSEFTDVNCKNFNLFSFSFVADTCVHLVNTHGGKYIIFIDINITSCKNSNSTSCNQRTNLVDQTSTEPFLTGEQVSSGDITDEQSSIRSTSIVQSTSAVTLQTVYGTDKITTKSSLTEELFSSSDITDEQSSVSPTSIVKSTSAVKIETVYDTDTITTKSSLTVEPFSSTDSTLKQFTVTYTSKKQSTSAVQSQQVADPTIIAVSVSITCVIFIIIIIIVLICTRKTLIQKLRSYRNTHQCTEASKLHTVNIDLPASANVKTNTTHDLSHCKYSFYKKPNENQNASTHESIISTSLGDTQILETENTDIVLYNNIQNSSSVVYTNVEGSKDCGSCIRTYDKNVEDITLCEDPDGKNSGTGTFYSKLGEMKRLVDNPYNQLASVDGVCGGQRVTDTSPTSDIGQMDHLHPDIHHNLHPDIHHNLHPDIHHDLLPDIHHVVDLQSLIRQAENLQTDNATAWAKSSRTYKKTDGSGYVYSDRYKLQDDSAVYTKINKTRTKMVEHITINPADSSSNPGSSS